MDEILELVATQKRLWGQVDEMITGMRTLSESIGGLLLISDEKSARILKAALAFIPPHLVQDFMREAGEDND